MVDAWTIKLTRDLFTGTWGWGMRGGDWYLDIRHGFRLLVREPVVSLAMVCTMVLGIGALSAVASLVYGVMLRPLPFENSEQLVRVSRTDGLAPSQFAVAGLPDLYDWRERSRTLSHVAGWSTTGATFLDGDGATRIVLAEVTEGFAEALGVRPAIGRLFNEGDYRGYQVWAPRSGLLTYALHLNEALELKSSGPSSKSAAVSRRRRGWGGGGGTESTLGPRKQATEMYAPSV